jgi:hypothetical protein
VPTITILGCARLNGGHTTGRVLVRWLCPRYASFASDPTKQQQWTAFVGEVAVNPGPLTDVVKNLATFLMRHAEKASEHISKARS